MKRIAIISLVLLMVCSVCACAKDETPDITTQPTTSTTTTAPAPVNPYTKFKIVLSAYNDYAQNESSPLPIEQIIFKDNDGCYITPIEDRIFTFFEEGAIEKNVIYTSGNFTLYHSPDMGGVMLMAMTNAWNSYATKCAEEHKSAGDLKSYLFKCDYFEGVYGVDENGQLTQSGLLEGTECGKFGGFTLYFVENRNQPQNPVMTDADRMVIIRNVYTKFVTEVALDGQNYEAIENYIFEKDGNLYRIREWIESAGESDIDQSASDWTYDGWRIYLAVKEEPAPTYDDIINAYSTFVADQALRNETYYEISDYLYFDEKAYYMTDEWLNVIPVEEEKIQELVGDLASETEYQGYTLYLYK